MRKLRRASWLWRGWLAVAMLLGGLFAHPQPTVAATDYLAAFICHAPGSDGDQPAPASSDHDHCQLCQAGDALGLVPPTAFMLMPGAWILERPTLRSTSWPVLPARRFYASRAPPRFG